MPKPQRLTTKIFVFCSWICGVGSSNYAPGCRSVPVAFIGGARNLQSSRKPSMYMVTTDVQCPEVGFLFAYFFYLSINKIRERGELQIMLPQYKSG